jgi:amino acid transporter
VAILDFLFGRPLADDEAAHEQIGPLAGVPVLGLDALSSAAYGPEAALTLLIPLGAAGLRYVLPISALIVSILAVVYLSYRQTIHAYPNGGGSYTVAKENLGTGAALLAGAALALDYVLNVAVGISAGVGALVSAVPSLFPYTLPICLGTLAMLTMVNLRGLREAGSVFLLPTYAFVGTLGATVVIGLVKSAAGAPVPVVAPPSIPDPTAAISAWLLVRAFASGCTAMTGVEAVSNGVPLFKEPTVRNAQRTLTIIIALLMALLLGIAHLCHVYGVAATEPGKDGYQSVLSMLVAAVMGRGVFYYVTIGAVVTVLCLSANTSFADFPRLCRVLADDHFLPDAYGVRGRRLVFSRGIVTLALLAGALIVGFKGVTDRLIPLFAIGAFLAFTLSQAGMVQHWRKSGGPGARHAMPLNAVGASATAATLVVVAVSKFTEGAWITIVVIPIVVLGFRVVNRHYQCIAAQILTDEPLSLEDAAPPIAVVAMQSWNKLTERGLAFALQVSPEVHALQVMTDSAKIRDMRRDWDELVVGPARAAGKAVPVIRVLPSRFRQLFQPFLDYVAKLRDENPGRDILVVIPDLVPARWYEQFLHNNRGTILRTLLRLRGGPRVIVASTPFQLRRCERAPAPDRAVEPNRGFSKRLRPV